MNAAGPPPVAERILDPHGDEAGRLVRGDDGALLLETARLAIFDLAAGAAAPPPRKTGWTLFAVMFGATASRGRPAATADPLAPLRAWAAEDAGRGARVYRTAAGYRLLIVAPALDPSRAETDALLARLGVDAASRRACRAAGRYRARLTPPEGAATCRFVEAIGPAADGEAAQLVELHDVSTRAFDRLPLG